MTHYPFRNILQGPTGVKGVLNFAVCPVGTETDGSLITTGATWVQFATAAQTAVKLLCNSTATSGDYATLRIRARADAAGNVIAGNFSGSAGANNFGNIFAVQGYASPNAYTNSSGSNIVCGVYSCIQATTSSSGRRWSTWIDDQSTTKAAGGHYLLRMSDNGATAKDGTITIYTGGRLPNLFNFEDVAGFVSTASGSITVSHKLHCTIAGVGDYYIPVASAIS